MVSAEFEPQNRVLDRGLVSVQVFSFQLCALSLFFACDGQRRERSG